MQTSVNVTTQSKPVVRGVVSRDGQSLTFAADTSFAQWRESVRILRGMERGIQFWIGDALNFGADRFGEDFAQEIEEGSARTWVNYAYVARQVHKSLRNDALMWSHYVAIAPLNHDEQIDMIGKIQEGSMNARDTQKAVRKLRGNPPPPKLRKWAGEIGNVTKYEGGWYEVTVWVKGDHAVGIEGTPVALVEAPDTAGGAKRPETGGEAGA